MNIMLHTIRLHVPMLQHILGLQAKAAFQLASQRWWEIELHKQFTWRSCWAVTPSKLAGAEEPLESLFLPLTYASGRLFASAFELIWWYRSGRAPLLGKRCITMPCARPALPNSAATWSDAAWAAAAAAALFATAWAAAAAAAKTWQCLLSTCHCLEKWRHSYEFALGLAAVMLILNGALLQHRLACLASLRCRRTVCYVFLGVPATVEAQHKQHQQCHSIAYCIANEASEQISLGVKLILTSIDKWYSHAATNPNDYWMSRSCNPSSWKHRG